MGNALIITGLVAGNGNGRPNVVELYAVEDDSIEEYTIRFNQNLSVRLPTGCCSGTSSYPNTITQGEFYTITDDATAFNSYFGVPANFTSQEIADAFATVGSPAGEVVIEILVGADTSDVFGNVNTNSWFYSGGWAYRNDGTTFDSNDGFVESDWTFAPGALDTGCPTNDACTCENPFPLGTYDTGTTPSNPPCPDEPSECVDGETLKQFCAADTCNASCIDHPHNVEICLQNALEEKDEDAVLMLRGHSHYLPDYSVDLCVPYIVAQALIAIGHATCGSCELI